jgi:hypothetical protein
MLLPDLPSGDALIELYPQVLQAAPALATVRVSRTSETIVGPGQDVVVGFSGGQSHQGIEITNTGSATVQLVLTPSVPSGPIVLTLPAEAHHTLAAQGAMGSSYTLTIHNVSSTAAARLQITENDYTAAAGVGSGGSFSASLRRDGHLGGEVVRVCVDGANAAAGNQVYLVVRTRDATVDVPAESQSRPAARVLLGPATPNPSFGRSTFVFSLAVASPVWVTVHDIAGRRVHQLLDGAMRPAGEHRLTWNGRDDRGRSLAPGVYLVRLRTPQGLESCRVVLLGAAGADM